MALELLNTVEGTVNGLPIAKGEDANLPCYFTPHFFAVELSKGLLVSNVALTLRQMIALLEQKGYNYSTLTVYYSLTQIEPEVAEETSEAIEEVEVEQKPKLRKQSKNRGN